MKSCRLVVNIVSLIPKITIRRVNISVQCSNDDVKRYSYLVFDISQIKLYI